MDQVERWVLMASRWGGGSDAVKSNHPFLTLVPRLHLHAMWATSPANVVVLLIILPLLKWLLICMVLLLLVVSNVVADLHRSCPALRNWHPAQLCC